MVGVVLLDVIRSVLRMQTSFTENDLQESLRGLTVPHLNVLCVEFQVKPSGTKSELIVKLVTFWKRENSVGESSAGHQRSFADSIDIEGVYRLDEGSHVTSRFQLHACVRLPYSQPGEGVQL